MRRRGLWNARSAHLCSLPARLPVRLLVRFNLGWYLQPPPPACCLLRYTSLYQSLQPPNPATPRARPEVMTVGLKTVRELVLRCPLVMEADLLTDLAQYKKFREKQVGAGGWGGVWRGGGEVCGGCVCVCGGWGVCERGFARRHFRVCKALGNKKTRCVC